MKLSTRAIFGPVAGAALGMIAWVLPVSDAQAQQQPQPGQNASSCTGANCVATTTKGGSAVPVNQSVNVQALGVGIPSPSASVGGGDSCNGSKSRTAAIGLGLPSGPQVIVGGGITDPVEIEGCPENRLVRDYAKSSNREQKCIANEVANEKYPAFARANQNSHRAAKAGERLCNGVSAPPPVLTNRW